MRRGKGFLIDTNVLLRHLLEDDPVQSPRAHALMARLEEASEEAHLEDVVLAETIWVLEKGCGVPRAEISEKVSRLVQLRGFRMRGKRAILEALARFGATRCDIADCLLAARARSRGMPVTSFDHDFDLLGCRWNEPA